MRHIISLILIAVQCFFIQAQVLPGFKISGSFFEQQMVIENSPPGTRILINATFKGFDNDDKVLLIFYALPNGNTIEQTFGKKLKDGDDWHFDIQHIGAQTRFLRQVLKNQTIVVVYLQAMQKSWSMWLANTPDSIRTLKTIVDDVRAMFAQWDPQVVLSSHSGGGRFIFSYIDAVEEIPDEVVRIAFLDSNYGYEDTISGPKIARWLKSGKNRYLCTLAYNDSVVIYNGKQLVSPTGGTWYRSKMMERYLAGSFRFRQKDKDTIIWNNAMRRRIEIILRTNPDNMIYHTRQVELNGFIHSILSGTRFEKKGYTYFGERAYSDLISDSIIVPIRRLNIPLRRSDAESGSAFMKRIAPLPLIEREEEIYNALASGNIPGFLRSTVTLDGEFADSAGIIHKVIYGWHKPDGNPIQPVYSGHVDWYVDYSHGIRFVNNQVLIDGKPVLFTDILQDPVLYKIFSDEDAPMEQVVYIKQ